MTKPLEGITIADFSRVLAAPLATQILADLGATVIKIERPGSGDETRSFEPRLPGGDSAYFFAFNRGKKSVTADLRTAEGKAHARHIAARADVVVENFLPGKMEAWGLGYDQLRVSNERLVYVSATGFGQTGPNRDKPGYDTIFQALSGIMSLTGPEDGDPAKAGIPVSDMTSGLWVAIAVLTGLVGRGTTGHGCHIDVSMMDVQVSLLALAAARVFALDDDPRRTGTEHPGRVPSAAFECADGGWVHVSGSDQHWRPLCEVLGLFDLGSDPELRQNSGRVVHRGRVMAELRAALSAVPRDEALSMLEGVGVPVGAVHTAREALSSEQVTARGMVGSFEHPTAGTFPAVKTPIAFTGYENPDFAAPPLLGADDREYGPALAHGSEGAQ